MVVVDPNVTTAKKAQTLSKGFIVAGANGQVTLKALGVSCFWKGGLDATGKTFYMYE